MVETVPWPPRLMLSWVAQESHRLGDLNSLWRKMGVPQPHSKDENDAG